MDDILKAIEQFERYQQSGWSKSEVPNSYYLTIALSALSEQAERQNGCEICTGAQKLIAPIACKYTESGESTFVMRDGKAKCCPECGRRLEVKHE